MKEKYLIRVLNCLLLLPPPSSRSFPMGSEHRSLTPDSPRGLTGALGRGSTSHPNVNRNILHPSDINSGGIPYQDVNRAVGLHHPDIPEEPGNYVDMSVGT